MNHVLKATPADCAAAIGSYNNPALALHPNWFLPLPSFIRPLTLCQRTYSVRMFFSVSAGSYYKFR